MILLVISLLSVFSSTGSLAYQHRAGNTFFYLFRQLKFILLGLAIIFFIHLIPYRLFSRLSVVALYVSVPLLILTLIAGTRINEAARWLQIPGTGLTIQPSDFAKVALVMYMARILAVNQPQIGDFKKVFGNLSLAIVITCALILPANFSTAIILFVTAFTLMFVGRVPVKYLLLMVFTGAFLLSVFIGGALLLDKEGRISTWKNRIEAYMDGEGDSYQADQAKVAIVTGGLFGKGPGNSTQRNLLPHPYSDFIYAIIIEEYGSLIGGLLMVALYMWLFFRAGLIIRRSRSTYGAFLAFGLCLGLVLQAFVNMAVAVGLVPVTGQTLPLVSMGGSSIFFTSMAAGMILSVSWGTEDLESEQSNVESVKREQEPLRGEEADQSDRAAEEEKPEGSGGGPEVSPGRSPGKNPGGSGGSSGGGSEGSSGRSPGEKTNGTPGGRPGVGHSIEPDFEVNG